MNETELERIVVRLVGDGSQYQKMLTQATESTDRTAKAVEQATKTIESLKNTLNGLGSTMMSALGAAGVAMSLKGAFDQFSKMQEGQIRLRNTIVATGQDVTTVTDSFKKLAEQVAATTLVTKGETLGMLQRATAMGLNSATAEKVVKNAIALAGATGQEAESMLRAAAAIERGNYQLARRQLGLQGVKDETELVRIVNNMMVGGMKTQEELANTTAGKFERLGRSLKSISADIGSVLADILGPVADQLQRFASWIKDKWESFASMTRRAWESVREPVLGFINATKKAVEDWYNYAVFTGTTLADHWELWTKTWYKWVVQAFDAMGLDFPRVATGIQNAWTRLTQFVYSAWVTSIANIKDNMTAFGTWLSTSGAARAIYRWMGFTEDVIDTTFQQMNREQQNYSAALQQQLERDLDRITRQAQEIVDRRNAALGAGGNAQLIADLDNQIAQITDRLAASWAEYQTTLQRNAANTNRQTMQLGLNAGGAFVAGIRAAISGTDAVEAFSAEAFSRLAAYRDVLTGPRPTGGGAPASIAPGLALGAAGGVSGAATSGMAGVLQAIAASTAAAAVNTRRIADNPVQINAANLEE